MSAEVNDGHCYWLIITLLENGPISFQTIWDHFEKTHVIALIDGINKNLSYSSI